MSEPASPASPPSDEQAAALDASLAWLLSRPGSGNIFIPGRAIRHALGAPVGQRAIDACVPMFLQPTDVGDRYCLTLAGLLKTSDPRPRRILGATLSLVANRYHRGLLDQRIVLWSDIRTEGGLEQSDFEIAWHSILTARIARAGGHVQGDRASSHPQYDYDFWLDENDLEPIAHHATVNEWLAFQARRYPIRSAGVANRDTGQASGVISTAVTTRQLVHELQQHAQGGTTDVGELLRRAKTIATKLRLDDTLAWVDHEIKGYPSGTEVPPYRVIPSELRIQNPFHGWKPVVWDGASDIQQHFDSAEIRSPIAEVAELASSQGDPSSSLHQAELDALIPSNPTLARLPSARVYSRTSFVRIIDNVRTRILEWALTLDTEDSTLIGVTPRKESKMTRPRPSMFIGSTVEALPVARAVQKEMDHELEITIWNQNLLSPGTATWLELVKKARNGTFDLALLVLGGEDLVTSRGATMSAPRDNILLELGIFAGALGTERTFFLYDRTKKPKLASDLSGITALEYTGDRADGNLQAAVGAACDQIREHVRQSKL